ncbi:MAG: response regulator [Gemmatimonadaceae bacterium]
MTPTGCRVLVVEDHELVSEAMTILLEAGGNSVRCASSVAAGVSGGLAWPADVMLLDLTLPDGSGLDVIGRLREAGALPPVTVALTGHDDPETVARCRAAGCHDVLLKPVPARELLQLVERWAAIARANPGQALPAES